jgi:hypothetical protein
LFIFLFFPFVLYTFLFLVTWHLGLRLEMKVGCIVQRKHFYRNHSSLNVRNVSGTWNVLFIYSQFLFSYLCLLLLFFINVDIRVNLLVFWPISTPEMKELVILHSADCIPYFLGVAMPDLYIHISKFPC